MRKWFKLFSSCIIVNGASQDLIYDLERNEFYDIPHPISQVLGDAEHMSFVELQDVHGEAVGGILQQFEAMELGFFTDTPERFPKLDLVWDSPYKVTNAIIEIDADVSYVKQALNELDALGTIGFQFRFLQYVCAGELKDILALFSGSRAKFIELILPFDASHESKELEDLWDRFPRIISVKFYGSPEEDIVSLDGRRKILYSTKDIIANPVEIIDPAYFITGVPLFAEAQKHNLGLNRKVGIDRHGRIKNYPDHANHFGYVGQVNICDVIRNEDFTRPWFVSNDQVEICKDCQYRYTCVSNSPLKMEAGKIQKISMCNFNPYENKWVKVYENEAVND